MKKDNIKWIFDKTKGNRFLLALLSVLVIISAFCALMIAYVLKLFVDIATGDSDYTIGRVVIMAVATVVMAGLIGVISSVLSAKIEASTEKKVKTLVLDKFFHGKLDQVEKFHSGEVLTKLTEDIGDVSSLFPNLATKLLGNASVAIFAIISLFLLNVKIAVAILIAIPVLIAIVSLFNFPIAKTDKKRKEAEESNRILMQEYIEKVKTIKVFRVQDRFLGLFGKNFNTLAGEKIKFGAWEGFASFCNSLIGYAMVLITLGFGSFLVMKNETTLGNLIAIVQLLNYIINPFSQVSQQISEIAKASVSVDRIKEIINVDSDVCVASDDNNDDFDELVVDDISYAYGDREVVEEMTATFERNHVYCVKGDNGIGKSTLLKLIAGLYDPAEGKVYFKDKNGEELPATSNPRISLLSADETLFSGSIRDNITLFAPEANANLLHKLENETNIAAVLAGVDNGYETEVKEGGKSLSSGQAQQIELCRALYYDARVILLDEPTSNLDRESVALFKKMLGSLKKDRIVIIVSHDDSITDACDSIYTMQEGKLAAA